MLPNIETEFGDANEKIKAWSEVPVEDTAGFAKTLKEYITKRGNSKGGLLSMGRVEQAERVVEIVTATRNALHIVNCLHDFQTSHSVKQSEAFILSMNDVSDDLNGHALQIQLLHAMAITEHHAKNYSASSSRINVTALLFLFGDDAETVAFFTVSFLQRMINEFLQRADTRSLPISDTKDMLMPFVTAHASRLQGSESMLATDSNVPLADLIEGIKSLVVILSPESESEDSIQTAKARCMRIDFLRAFKVYDSGIAFEMQARNQQNKRSKHSNKQNNQTKQKGIALVKRALDIIPSLEALQKQITWGERLFRADQQWLLRDVGCSGACRFASPRRVHQP